MLARCRSRPRQSGAVTLLLCGMLLLMVVLIAAATLQMLLSGRQLAVMQRERELAFRAAEAALRDGEAELLAAAASLDAQDRLAPWPAPGRCGSGQQAGLCRPALAGPPVWQPWLRADAEVDAIGVPLGRFTGAALPADAAAQEPPRYVAEILDEAPAGYSAPDPASALAPAPRMRVTAIGFGRTRAVRALLQSVIQP
ncbi:putative type 4 fimbrial biogenesis pilX-related signal peptide protein [Cupriavidus taiwanensis]|uniref:Type 4 fimbrial biogenesis pilX-related signal peptide protein n=1 Tax=Cupriavidus taiwanensis TaxID=164546 RepID=A0A375BND4_9BURK|nr:pilus assembly protein [Cupriavidus taiwanensis]SOY48667.1 putative type 4 fimbrial biogenesis pilX-related signal peptide protein [Cupriavidus taiwanensis]